MTEDFRKGWWNCFCSFANSEPHSENISIVASEAGVTPEEIDHALAENPFNEQAKSELTWLRNQLIRQRNECN